MELVLVMAAVIVVVLVIALNRAATVIWRRRKRIKRREVEIRVDVVLEVVPFPTRKTGNVPLAGTCLEDGSEIWVEGGSGLRVMRLLRYGMRGKSEGGRGSGYEAVYYILRGGRRVSLDCGGNAGEVHLRDQQNLIWSDSDTSPPPKLKHPIPSSAVVRYRHRQNLRSTRNSKEAFGTDRPSGRLTLALLTPWLPLPDVPLPIHSKPIVLFADIFP